MKMDSAGFTRLLKSKFDLEDAWVHVREDSLCISQIIVPKKLRGRGIGTEVMKYIVSFARSTNRDIFLSPSDSFGASSVSRLVRFYKRFGFVENKGRNKDFQNSESMHLKIRVSND